MFDPLALQLGIYAAVVFVLMIGIAVVTNWNSDKEGQ